LICGLITKHMISSGSTETRETSINVALLLSEGYGKDVRR
jgi:hypothetical protein